MQTQVPREVTHSRRRRQMSGEWSGTQYKKRRRRRSTYKKRKIRKRRCCYFKILQKQPGELEEELGDETLLLNLNKMAVYLGVLPFKQWKKRYKKQQRRGSEEEYPSSPLTFLSSLPYRMISSSPSFSCKNCQKTSSNNNNDNDRVLYPKDAVPAKSIFPKKSQLLPLLWTSIFLLVSCVCVPSASARSRNCEDLKIGELIV